MHVPGLPLVPRLPVLGWHTFAGAKAAGVPCLLDHPGVMYTTSGRAAILLAMERLGVRAGFEVLIPTYHCPTMVAPAEELHATVVFYPVTPTGAADLAWLERMAGPKARVILAPHFFGLPQPMAALRNWCDQRGISMIEDCAHALFGQSENRAIGAWGDIAIGSLTKFLPVPEGGCWVTHGGGAVAPELQPCSALAQVRAVVDMVEVGARHHRFPGLSSALDLGFKLMKSLRPGKPVPASTSPSGSDSEAMDGFTIDAVLAHRALTGASRWLSEHAPRMRNVETRRRNYRSFARLLAQRAGFKPLFPELPDHCAPYVFPLWVQSPDPGYQQLRAASFPVSRWDRLWPNVPALAGDVGVQWSHHILQLACHQDLSDEDVAHMSDTIVSLYSE